MQLFTCQFSNINIKKNIYCKKCQQAIKNADITLYMQDIHHFSRHIHIQTLKNSLMNVKLMK